MSIERRGFILGLLSFLFPSIASARSKLKIKYELHKSKFSNKPELALKIPIRKEVNYFFISELYTGDQKNVSEIKRFNDNVKVVYNGNTEKPNFMWIPKRLLKFSLQNALAENKFSIFVIENEEGESEVNINTLWDIAQDFMNNKLNINERVNILLAINDEINPISTIVYNNQEIIVPESLVEDIKEDVEKPNLEPKKPKTAKPGNKKQNPYKIDIKEIKNKLRAKDKFGARRVRGSGKKSWKSKHQGIDLVAPIGTELFPIENGMVIFAAKDKKRWRNGNRVSYITESGLDISYLHLKTINCKTGQKLNLNTLIGKVGITGNASADNPHVHVQIKIRIKGKWKIVDPTPFVVVDT